MKNIPNKVGAKTQPWWTPLLVTKLQKTSVSRYRKQMIFWSVWISSWNDFTILSNLDGQPTVRPSDGMEDLTSNQKGNVCSYFSCKCQIMKIMLTGLGINTFIEIDFGEAKQGIYPHKGLWEVFIYIFYLQ